MEKIKVTMIGKSPLLLHRGGLADPLDFWSKQMKQITSKRKKTEVDQLELRRLEWFGSLYTHPDDDARVVIPAELVYSMLVKAAKQRKMGDAAKAGLFEVPGKAQFDLQYDGPKGDLDALYAEERFADVRGVKVGTSRVMRCRPRFAEWKLQVEMEFDETVVNPSQVLEWFQIAGDLVGLGDYRPRYGRFTVSK